MKQLHITTELADGTVLESSTSLPDFLLFERTARKHGWSTTPSDNPAVWEAFLAWSSLRRTKQYEGTWESFSDGDVANVDASTARKVPPTESAPGTEP